MVSVIEAARRLGITGRMLKTAVSAALLPAPDVRAARDWALWSYSDRGFEHLRRTYDRDKSKMAALFFQREAFGQSPPHDDRSAADR